MYAGIRLKISQAKLDLRSSKLGVLIIVMSNPQMLNNCVINSVTYAIITILLFLPLDK